LNLGLYAFMFIMSEVWAKEFNFRSEHQFLRTHSVYRNAEKKVDFIVLD